MGLAKGHDRPAMEWAGEGTVIGALLAVALLLSSCVVDLDAAQEGFPCNPDGVCDHGLECVDGRCVAPEDEEEEEPVDPPRESCERGETVPCYEVGPPELAGIGECNEGFRVCLGDDTFSACLQDGAPAREVCDGRDTNCDGITDNPDALYREPCGVGACAEHFRQGCDGICDLPEGVGPEAEDVCGDDVDNDCSGVPDEGCPCEGREGEPCYGLGLDHPTLGVGQCRAGVYRCEDGSITACEGQILPRAEVCDGRDRSCDGIVDGDDPLLGAPCDTGLDGSCAEGRMDCDDGELVCAAIRGPVVGPTGGDILCDGIDESCSGSPDEGLDVPGTAVNCAESEACCGGACVDLSTDPEHCGRCFSDCSQTADVCLLPECVDGYCRQSAAPDGTPCLEDLVCVAGDCVDYCLVEGDYLAAGDEGPEEPCAVCAPESSREALSELEDGTACPGGVCHRGTCRNGCFIDGVFRDSGLVEPGNVCNYCDPAQDIAEWSARVGASCDDGNECTIEGVCDESGQCVGEPLDDGIGCAGGEGECYSGRCRLRCATPWGEEIEHGESVTAYEDSQVPYDESCVEEERVCDDGNLSGSYEHPHCEVADPQHLRLHCWGGNDSGQLGDGTTIDRSAPTPIGSDQWLQVASRTDHSCAIRFDGALFCWGDNEYGQLGDGTTTNRMTPTRVGASEWKQVATGWNHTCAIRDDDRLLCWGRNDYGQLGDGTSSPSQSPVLVGTGLYEQVQAGGLHSCAIREDGRLLCWGRNDYGQLGLGDGNERLSPEPVGEESWEQVSAVAYYTCAIREGQQTLYCWGNNMQGQLGDGTISTRGEPTAVDSPDAFRMVSTMFDHTCAVRSGDERLFCWGRNTKGQLGDGTTTRRLSPVQVGAASWEGIDLGREHTCGVRQGGELYCWGANDYGQLGFVSPSDVLEPALTDSGEWVTTGIGTNHSCAVGLPGE